MALVSSSTGGTNGTTGTAAAIAAVDIWEVGTEFSHQAMWGFYSITNYLGAIMCTFLIWVLVRAKKKPVGDIFVIGLCSGCEAMSIPCATQCLLNWISGTNRFQHGWIACELEAFFHVSAIMVQFFSITGNALCNYYQCVYRPRKAIPHKYAWFTLFLIWTVGELVTYGFSTISEAYLMPAGAYCFYKFNSPLIYGWFATTMTLSLVMTIGSFVSIFRRTRAIKLSLGRMAPSDKAHMETITLARRSIILVVIYFVGWFPAVIACFYTLVTGVLIQELDLVLAICGSLHSVFVPLAYGYTNRRLHKYLARCQCLQKHLKFLQSFKLAQHKSHQTVVTNWSRHMHGSVEESDRDTRTTQPKPTLSLRVAILSDNSPPMMATTLTLSSPSAAYDKTTSPQNPSDKDSLPCSPPLKRFPPPPAPPKMDREHLAHLDSQHGLIPGCLPTDST